MSLSNEEASARDWLQMGQMPGKRVLYEQEVLMPDLALLLINANQWDTKYAPISLFMRP